jgi:hypothetical protein
MGEVTSHPTSRRVLTVARSPASGRNVLRDTALIPRIFTLGNVNEIWAYVPNGKLEAIWVIARKIKITFHSAPRAPKTFRAQQPYGANFVLENTIVA